jgi:hypothetical protein
MLTKGIGARQDYVRVRKGILCAFGHYANNGDTGRFI